MPFNTLESIKITYNTDSPLTTKFNIEFKSKIQSLKTIKSLLIGLSPITGKKRVRIKKTIAIIQ